MYSYVRFELHPLLTSNLSFHTIYFHGACLKIGPRGIHDCSHDSSVSFCDHYSSFSYFPAMARFVVDIKFNFQVDIFEPRAEYSFSVIDRKMIRNIDLKRYKYNFYLDLTYALLLGEKKIIKVLLLQVKKPNYLVITFNNITSFLVFDGPGYLSKLLNSFSQIVVTSSFQCVIQFMHHEYMVLGSLNYESKPLSISQELNISSIKNYSLHLQIPSTIYGKSPQMIKIITMQMWMILLNKISVF